MNVEGSISPVIYPFDVNPTIFIDITHELNAMFRELCFVNLKSPCDIGQDRLVGMRERTKVQYAVDGSNVVKSRHDQNGGERA
jgi:hypothetical protein